MYTVGVIYESREEGDLQIINFVRAVLREKKDVALRERRGGDASIVDINASDVVIFASDGNGELGINSSFAEIVRALKGVNLAGRMLGIISFDGEETVSALKEAFHDSCITCYEPLVCEGEISEATVKKWVEKLLEKYKESINGRE